MKYIHYTFLALALLLITSCERVFMDKEPATSPQSVFEQTWTFADENYSFFEFKKIDWDAVKTEYQAKISEEMSDEALFDTLANMLFLLRDGHVNLSSDFNRSKNWNWYLDYPANYNFALLERNYFNNQEQYVGSFTVCDFEDVGYMQYHSFMDAVSQDDMDYILNKFKDYKGIIIDVRNNGGGSLANVYSIGNHFVAQETEVAQEQYKSGPGHEDFNNPPPSTLSPADSSVIFTKPVVILTNRQCFSATTFFTTMMRELPNVTILGDNIGGGGGAPSYTELSNGWVVRVSSTRLLTLDGFNVEDGAEPDIKVEQTDADTDSGKDTLLEAALALLREN